MSEKPTLEVIDGGLADAPAEEPEAPTPAPETAKQGVSIGDVVTGYADLIATIRRSNTKVTEGGLIKLIEIAVNSHFTSISLGQQAAQIRALATPPEEDTDADGSEA